MKKISILFIFSLILGLFVSEVSAAGPRLKKRPKHVVLVAFDGLSAVAIRNHPMPNFNRLMKEGASTLNNRSILPSSSAPNWASMFTGVGPELHGYTTWEAKHRKFLLLSPTNMAVFRDCTDCCAIHILKRNSVIFTNGMA